MKKLLILPALAVLLMAQAPGTQAIHMEEEEAIDCTVEQYFMLSKAFSGLSYSNGKCYY